jgi:hypothetical protein
VIATAATILARTAGCALLFWWIWRTFGLAAAMPVVGLFGVALARPLIDLAEALGWQMRRAHWRDVEGRHYAYRGRPVAVVEDDEHRHWLRLADVRAIVGFTASDGALAVSYPGRLRELGRPAAAHVRDDALLAHLAKERSPEAARLRQWVEREVAFPARRRRERLGIRTRPPDAVDSN